MNQNKIPSWDEYFLNICDVVKTRSKDPKRQVGCCLVSLLDNKILSLGYNGLKPGVNDNINWNDRDLVNSLVLHAEINCIARSNPSIEESKLYSSTSPCMICIKVIATKNIKKIIFKDKYKDFEEVKKVCNYYNILIEQYKFN